MSAVSIDIYLCSGCGGCVDLCPTFFCISPLTGKAELIDPDQPVTDCCREAALFCPEQCIVINV
jgi:ferredoxin